MKIFTPPKPSGGKKFTGRARRDRGRAARGARRGRHHDPKEIGTRHGPDPRHRPELRGLQPLREGLPVRRHRADGPRGRPARTSPPPSSTWGSARSAAPAWRPASATRPSSSRARTFKGQDIKKYSGICVFAEHRRGKLASRRARDHRRGARAAEGALRAGERDPRGQRRARSTPTSFSPTAWTRSG